MYHYIVKQGYGSAYFGLTDSKTEGIWKWVTDEDVSYINWHSGEPNNQNNNENYAMFYYQFPDGTWNDGDFKGSAADRAFICEWDLGELHNYNYKFKNEYYLSTPYNDFENNDKWITVETTTIKSGDFDWANAVVGLINANAGDDNALEVDVNNDSTIAKISLAGSVINMVNGFVSGGREGITNVKVMLQTNGKEKRMLLMYGNTIEETYAGKTLWLSTILSDAHSGESAYPFLHADKDQDSIIRGCFSELKQDVKYSMKIKFSNYKEYEDSPYKYTIVIDKNGTSYQYPIIHSGTRFEVYYKPAGGKTEFAFDATDLIRSEKVELSKEFSQDIIKYLRDASWQKNAKTQKITVTTPVCKTLGDKAFSLNASARTTLSYKSDNESVVSVSTKGKVTLNNVGTAKIMITATGTDKYTRATKQVTIKVCPKGTVLSSVESKTSGTLSVKWKGNNDISGYQLQYALSSDFSNAAEITLKDKNTITKTLRNLKKGTKYYIRIRTYKTVSGKNYYSKWSSKISKKTQK